VRGALDQVGGSRDLEQPQIRASGDGEQDAVSTLDAGLE
jgi:hypothetical protein